MPTRHLFRLYDSMIRQQAEEDLRIMNAVAIAQTGDKEGFENLRKRAFGAKKVTKTDEVLEKGRRQAANAFTLINSPR